LACRLAPRTPAPVRSIYGLKAPPAPRKDLQEIFLTGTCKACGPIAADLNSQQLNKDVAASSFVPAEELRLNTSVPVTASPSRLGVLAKDLQGFPNGRRLTDDVVDIELQALEGAAQTGTIVPALAAGDGVNTPASPPGSAFPYLALPNAKSVNLGTSNAAGSTMPKRGGQQQRRWHRPIGPGADSPGAGDRRGAGHGATRHRTAQHPP